MTQQTSHALVWRTLTRAVFVLCGVGFVAFTLWFGAIGQSSTKGTFKTAQEIPWAGDLISQLRPAGDLLAETNHYYTRNHHFVRACGNSDPEAFAIFRSSHGLNTLSGEYWPAHKNDWIPPEMQSRFRFSGDDYLFIGDVSMKNGEQAHVEGAFCPSTHSFVIEVASRGGAD